MPKRPNVILIVAVAGSAADGSLLAPHRRVDADRGK